MYKCVRICGRFCVRRSVDVLGGVLGVPFIGIVCVGSILTDGDPRVIHLPLL